MDGRLNLSLREQCHRISILVYRLLFHTVYLKCRCLTGSGTMLLVGRKDLQAKAIIKSKEEGELVAPNKSNATISSNRMT
ncbi:hypothetical protein GMJAKD_15275 [Candidatus Electrothrix aarhusensis]